MDAIDIARSALDVEWRRLEVIAQNFANLNTTRTESGDAYRPLRLVSGPDENFATMLAQSDATAMRGVRVLGVEQVAGGTRQVFEPDHPHADADGFVQYPELDHAAEMALMIKTSRIYEANLTTLSLAQQMYAKALEMGR